MAGEQVEFEVGLNTRQFDTGMVKMRGQLEGGAGSLDRYRNSLGGAATATSGVAGAMSGLGGRAKDVIGAVDNLAMAVATGGPLAVGLTGIALGVGVVVTKFIEAKKKAIDLENQLRRTAAFGLSDYAAEVAALEKELQNVGRTGIDARIGLQEENFAAAATAVESYEKDLARVNLTLEDREMRSKASSHYDKEIAGLRATKASLEAKLARERENQDLATTAIGLLGAIKDAEGEVTKAAEKRGVAQGKANKAAVDDMDEHVKAFRAEQDRLAFEMNDVPEIEMPSFEDQLFGIDLEDATRKFNEFEEKKREAARVTAEERVRLAEMARDAEVQSAMANADAIMGFVVPAIGLVSTFVTDMVTGQEHAFERLLAGFMQMVGGQMVGIGTRQIAEGVGLALLGDPKGFALAGWGAGVVGVGIGMGATGAGIAASLQGGAGGPGGGVTSSSRSTSVEGTGRRRSLEANNGGQQVSNYIFNAPVMGDPNQAARFIAQQQRRAETQLLEGRRRR